MLVGGGGGAPASIVTLLGVIETGNSVNITAPCLVVVCVHHMRTSAPGRSLSSVTIDGSAGTIHAQVGANATSGAGVGIASRDMAAGTSIAISWALSGTVLAGNNRAAVYTVTGLSSPTPHDTATANGNDPTGQLDLPANGVLIAAAVSDDAAQPFTWTGIINEDTDAGMSNARRSSGHNVPTSLTLNHSVSPASLAGNEVLAAVSWA